MILSKISDPRVDPARTSVTAVVVPEDLLTAKVYVSVLGTEAEQRRTIRALQHAAGYIQELMARQVTLRHTPVLVFQPDTKLKKTLATLEVIRQAAAEARQTEARNSSDEER